VGEVGSGDERLPWHETTIEIAARNSDRGGLRRNRGQFGARGAAPQEETKADTEVAVQVAAVTKADIKARVEA
jgi:hypothetical protein